MGLSGNDELYRGLFERDEPSIGSKVLKAVLRREGHPVSFDDESSRKPRRKDGAEGSRNGSSPREHAKV